MSSPPSKRKKVFRQLTLFGGIATGQAVHAKEKNLYEKFVNAFTVRYFDAFGSKAETVSKAQEKWKQIKDVEGES